jgi:hypothetical protein
MRKTVLIIGLLFLVLNIGIGLLISKYLLFNIVLNSAIIVATTILIWLSMIINLKKGFVVSLPFIFAFIGMIQFVLGCISPTNTSDNWYIIIILLLLAFEITMLIITKTVSKLNK